uniref:Uncharacterized protein n=1 Tax=Arundo donax TaxID=35708 RepID=A0A0A9DHL3_ARUDO
MHYTATVYCNSIIYNGWRYYTVMYIVDFQRAVYYQKCYDPDCQGMQGALLHRLE